MARNAIIPIFIPHLGCKNDCVFCDQRSISGQVAAPSPADVAESIKAGLARLASRNTRPEVAFYGGSFTAIAPEAQEAYLAATAPFLRSGALASIRVSTRPDAIDDSVLARLARFGVETIELGAQSMDDAVLRASRRGHTSADTRRAAKRVKEAGFSLVLQMMVGLPGDCPDGAVATAEALADLSPNGVRIYPTVVLVDTALEALWHNGAYEPLSPDAAAEICARLIAVFSARQIPILRIGLNESELLASQAVAGAYHPALGELCYARWYLHRMRAILAQMPEARAITVRVAMSRASIAAGHKRSNLRILQSEFPNLRVIRIEPVLSEADALEIVPNDAPR